MHLLHSSIADTALVATQHFPKFSINSKWTRRTAGSVHNRRKAQTMAFTSTPQAAPTLMERLIDTKNTLAARYAQYRVYRTTLTELRTLSMRELTDLGLSPSNLKSVAYEAAYK